MKVVLVPRHTDNAPLLDATDDIASSNECEFLRSSRCVAGGAPVDLWLAVLEAVGRPLRPRGGEGVLPASNWAFVVKKLGSSSESSSWSSSRIGPSTVDDARDRDGSSKSLS
jgi:hypothetical protein